MMVVLCAVWGLNQVAIKVANEGISPVLQAGLRSTGATVLVSAWCFWRGTRLFARDGSLLPGLGAAALFAAEFAVLYWGLVYTTASRAVLFLYMAPFVVAVGAHIFVPGERLRTPQVIGLLCAFAGIALAFADALRLPSHRELVGDVLELAAALLWGATTVLVKASRLARIDPSRTLLYQLAGSAAALPVVSWALGEHGITAPTPLVLGALAYQTVVVAAISYMAWFALMTRYPASQLSAFSFLTPLFGLLAGALLLGEPITGGLAAAMLCVAFGIYLVNRRPAAARTAASPAAVAGPALTVDERGSPAVGRAEMAHDRRSRP